MTKFYKFNCSNLIKTRKKHLKTNPSFYSLFILSTVFLVFISILLTTNPTKLINPVKSANTLPAYGGVNPTMNRVGMQFENEPKSNLSSVDYGSDINAGIPNCQSGFQVGNCKNNSPTISLTGTIRDFKGINEGGHPDFESVVNTPEKNIVKSTLGQDRKPVYNGPAASLTTKENFDKWYNDSSQTIEHSIELTDYDGDGVYTYDSSDFFPINNKLHGNTTGESKNFHFTYEVHSEFTYEKGQSFRFRGDDDVWVFIDNKLVIDIGGVHGALEGSVDLDTLGLTPDNTYKFDFFFAERHRHESNFRIDTSIVNTATDERCCETEASGGKQIIKLPSSTKTKVLNTTENTVKNEWLDPNFDDSSWQDSKQVWSGLWTECFDWYPNEGDTDQPTACQPGGFVFFDPNGTNPALTIQSTSDVNRPDLAKDFFRQKFIIPPNSIINEAYLYFSSDNTSKFWVDGNPINANQDNSLNSQDDSACNGQAKPGSFSGGINKIDIKNLINKSDENHVVSASLLNAKHCNNTNHPMGMQFYIYVEYTPTSAIGGNECWIGGIDRTETIPDPTDHTIDLWFEYYDKNNPQIPKEQNKAFRHKLAFVNSESVDKLGKDPELVFQNEIEDAAEFFIEFADLSSNSPDACLKTTTLKGTELIDNKGCYTDDTNGLVTIVKSNRQLFANNKVRIDYKIRFTKNKEDNSLNFPTDKYTIYAIGEYKTENGEWIADNYETNDPSAAMAWGQYSRKGVLGIDTTEPKLELPPPEVTSYNGFNFNWSHNELSESGLNSFENYCYSSEDPSFILFYRGYSFIDSITKKLFNKDLASQTMSLNSNEQEYINCMDKDEEIALINNANLKTKYSFPTNNEYSYLRLNDLEVKTKKVMDNACNIADPAIHDPQAEEPWLTTRQGTFHSDTNLDLEVPPPTNNSLQGYNFFTIENSNMSEIWNNSSSTLSKISSDMLSGKSSIDTNNKSVSNQKLENYFDTNFKPPPGADEETWYEYAKFLLNVKGINTEIKSIASDRTISSISQLDTTCSDRCYYEIKNKKNLTISNSGNASLCDRQAIVFIEGDLTIKDDFINQNDSNACIFFVKGDLKFKNSTTTKDSIQKNNLEILDTKTSFPFEINSRKTKKTFIAPDVGTNKIIGVKAVFHDNGRTWSYTPTINFSNGESTSDVTHPCWPQSSFGEGTIDVCTTENSLHTITLKSNDKRTIDSVSFFYDTLGDPTSFPVTFFELKWIINSNTNSSAYDLVEGFFIVEGEDTTVSTEKNVELSDLTIYSDAFMLRGGIVANDYYLARNLGLRNNIQPAEFIIYDPKYTDLFSDALGYTTLKIREK